MISVAFKYLTGRFRVPRQSVGSSLLVSNVKGTRASYKNIYISLIPQKFKAAIGNRQ